MSSSKLIIKEDDEATTKWKQLNFLDHVPEMSTGIYIYCKSRNDGYTVNKYIYIYLYLKGIGYGHLMSTMHGRQLNIFKEKTLSIKFKNLMVIMKKFHSRLIRN